MTASQPGKGGLSPIPGPSPAPRRNRAARGAIALLLVVAVLATVAAAAMLAGRGASPSPSASALPDGSVAAVIASADPSAAAPAGTLAPGTTASPVPATNAPTATPAPTLEPKTPPPTSVPPEDLTGYVWPLRDARITSRYGARDFGGFVVVDGEEIHDGLDLATFCGNRVRAAHDGTVLYAGRKFDAYMGYLGDGSAVYERLERQGRLGTLPIVIVIDDGNGYRSVYVHLSKAEVEPGQEVQAGDVIGREGMTGFATGCHLHYALVRMDGPWQVVVPELRPYGYPPLVRERVDPLRVLPKDHPDAPARLRNRFASPSPGTSAPSVSPSPSLPAASPSTAPSASPPISATP